MSVARNQDKMKKMGQQGNTKQTNRQGMKTGWKFWGLLVLLFCLSFPLTGCNEKQDETYTPGTVLSETGTSIEIVDMAGRAVTVPKNSESYAFVYRVVARFLISLDCEDGIVGAGKPEEFLNLIAPRLSEVPSIGQGVVDMEALAEVNPDVFFHKAGDVKTMEAVEKLGIPSVGLLFETPDDMLTALKIMGIVCNSEEKADALIDYYHQKIIEQQERVSVLGEAEKKTAIMMGTSIGKVADKTMLQSNMIESAGGINPASDVEATELWPTVGVEEIFEWNPDYIFITNSQSATYTVEDLMSDPAWSALKAIKNKHVYVMPAAVDSWEFPGVVSVLGTDYIIRTMYPDIMSDVELVDAVNAFYELSYGIVFSRNELGY
jgi:ABC-type Fe3+-hydroxamate transport system substrate-binding protein